LGYAQGAVAGFFEEARDSVSLAAQNDAGTRRETDARAIIDGPLPPSRSGGRPHFYIRKKILDYGVTASPMGELGLLELVVL